MKNYLKKLYNPEIKLAYIQQTKQGFTEKSREVLLYAFAQIGTYEAELNKDLALFEDYEYVQLFQRNHWYRKDVVNRHKSLIRAYLRWYIQSAMPEHYRVDITATLDSIRDTDIDGSDIYQTEWFKNPDELDQSIRAVRAADHILDPHICDLPAAICVLAYGGVQLDHICGILKTDVQPKKSKVVFSQESFALPKSHMQYVTGLRDTEGYERLVANRPCQVTYKHSPFLLRSIRQVQLTPNAVSLSLKRFTQQAQEAGVPKRFVYNKIYWSGMYNRLVTYERNKRPLTRRDVAAISHLLEREYTADQTSFHNRFYDYEKFKAHFYPRGLSAD